MKFTRQIIRVISQKELENLLHIFSHWSVLPLSINCWQVILPFTSSVLIIKLTKVEKFILAYIFIPAILYIILFSECCISMIYESLYAYAISWFIKQIFVSNFTSNHSYFGKKIHLLMCVSVMIRYLHKVNIFYM